MGDMHCAPDAIAIGIDVGATQTRVAAVDGSGCVLSLRRSATVGRDVANRVGWSGATEPRASARAGRCDERAATAGGLFDAFVTGLAQMVTEASDSADRGPATGSCLGLAIPGTLDPPRHAVVRSVSLPFLEGRRLGEEVGERLGRSAVLLTDAEASTWGEFRLRERHPESFVHLRIGSGVACGVVLGGELLRLDAGRTGHLDMLIVDHRPDAPQCRCGRRGCLEAIASGTALNEHASMIGITDGIAGLQAAWESGDEAARRIVGDAAVAVAAVIRSLAECYRVNMICIGGGVVAHLPSLLHEVMDHHVSSFMFQGGQHAPLVEPARLGDDAGVIGAGLLAMRPDCLRA